MLRGAFSFTKKTPKWSVCVLVNGLFFIYNNSMNTDYIIRLQMCGMTRLEAILICDEFLEDGDEDTLEAYVKAMEKNDVRRV